MSYEGHIFSVFSIIQETTWPVEKLSGYTKITARAPPQHMWASSGPKPDSTVLQTVEVRCSC